MALFNRSGGHNEMLRVIGSGFGRTGTLSMKKALEQLGYGPCYHMTEVMPNSKRVLTWYKIAAGEKADWHEVMEGYQATVDFPACVYYRELMEAFPDAKVVHTVRDPERWYQSTYETIYQFSSVAPGWLQKLVWPLARIMYIGDRLIWNGVFADSFQNRQRAIEIYEQHTENVRVTVPPDQLLVFDVKEGWEPLCRFLDVPVPDVPFPHVNDSDDFRRMNKRLYRLFHFGPIALLVVFLLSMLLLI